MRLQGIRGCERRKRRPITTQSRHEYPVAPNRLQRDFTADRPNWFAAYGFWIFKYYGHENVSLMDGGLKKWKAEGRPMTAEVPSYPPTNYKVKQINYDYRADRDYIKQRLGKPNFEMVDVRRPA